MILKQVIEVYLERWKKHAAELEKCKAAEYAAMRKFEETEELLVYFQNHQARQDNINAVWNELLDDGVREKLRRPWPHDDKKLS